MALTEAEVKALEKEADLARRRNIAAANLADARGTAGMQRAYNQMRAESDMAAHERYMARRRAFAERNPLAVPGEERRRLQLQEDRGSLRAHEKAMLDKRNANSLAIAQENRGAAREQGLEAAKATGKANIKLGKINQGIKEKEFELAQQKLAQEKELETLKGKNTIDAINAQNKGSERVETIRGESNVKVATEQAKGNLSRDQLKRDLKSMDIAAQMADRERRETGKDNRERDNRLSKEFNNAIDESMARGMSYTEAVAEYKQVHQNDPQRLKDFNRYLTAKNEIENPNPNSGTPKEGDERAVQGGTAVYHNGQWMMKK